MILNEVGGDTNLGQINAQGLYTIYLKTLAIGNQVTDSTDLAFIYTLAHSCPYDAGDAVYMARSMSALYFSNEIGLDDDVLCSEDTSISHEMRHHNTNEPSSATADSVIARVAFAKLAPNPASNATTIIYNSGYASYNKLEIYDNLGKVIWSTSVTGSEGKVSIDLTGMSEGIYLVRFTTDDKLLLGTKLVVNK